MGIFAPVMENQMERDTEIVSKFGSLEPLGFESKVETLGPTYLLYTL